MTRLVIAGALLAVAVGGVARADQDQPMCLKETQRLCPLVPVGLVQACLQAHIGQLGAECRAHVGSVNQNIDRMNRDCSGDADRLCPEPQTAAGQRAACLAQHRDSLSPRCRQTLDAISDQQ